MLASNLKPGMHLAGILPPIEGVRDRCEVPVVRRVRRIFINHRLAEVHVRWVGGGRGVYLPTDVVEELDVRWLVPVGTAVPVPAPTIAAGGAQ